MEKINNVYCIAGMMADSNCYLIDNSENTIFFINHPKILPFSIKTAFIETINWQILRQKVYLPKGVKRRVLMPNCGGGVCNLIYY